MFAHRMFFWNLEKYGEIPPNTPEIGNGIVLLIGLAGPFG